jgi:hypothetical protein
MVEPEYADIPDKPKRLVIDVPGIGVLFECDATPVSAENIIEAKRVYTEAIAKGLRPGWYIIGEGECQGIGTWRENKEKINDRG